MNSACPCCLASLAETTEAYFLQDILHAWEQHGVAFSARTRADYADNPSLTVHACPRCGFGVFLPMVIGSNAFYSDISRGEYYLPDRWDFHVALKEMERAGADSLLDVGCGSGAFLSLVRKRLPRASLAGIDANPEARSVLPSGISLLASLDAIPAASQDVVTLFQVIEHVADPFDMLQKARTALRPGGLLVVSVPDHSGPIRFFSYSHTAVPPHHVTRWMPGSLEHILKRLEFSVERKLTEPLPDYLFDSYFPVIVLNALRCSQRPKIAAFLRKYIANPLLSIFKALKLRSLPLRGHTYLVVARKKT